MIHTAHSPFLCDATSLRQDNRVDYLDCGALIKMQYTQLATAAAAMTMRSLRLRGSAAAVRSFATLPPHVKVAMPALSPVSIIFMLYLM